MSDERTSRAVIANGAHGGAVLWHTGAALYYEIYEAGLTQLDELGLDDAPEGVSIWEGAYEITCGCNPGVSLCNCSLDVCECDPSPVGAFRTLTNEEWSAVMAGRSPLPPGPNDPRNETE